MSSRGPRIYSFKELMELLLAEIGRKRILMPVPWGIARLQAAVLGLLPQPPLTLDQLKLLQRDNIAERPAPGLRRARHRPRRPRSHPPQPTSTASASAGVSPGLRPGRLSASAGNLHCREFCLHGFLPAVCVLANAVAVNARPRVGLSPIPLATGNGREGQG